MKKTVKMVLYAEPGVGKSTFAANATKPFFICTDGNYEWLDRPEEDHVEVSSWAQTKKIFSELGTEKYAKYDTIVVDLIEDLFKWVEYEYCIQNKLNHISDIGYAKGYDSTRNEFYIEISKVLGLNKNVILISHGLTKVEKDRRGVENTKYIPSTRIPDKVWDMIEGRVRYFLRAYVKGEEDAEGNMLKKRYLSIVPKENEYGISRGLDESKVPHDIELDWNTFAAVIGLDDKSEPVKPTPAPKKVEVPKPTTPKVVKEEPTKPTPAKVEPKSEVKAEQVTPPASEAEPEAETPEEAPVVVEAEPVEESTPAKAEVVEEKPVAVEAEPKREMTQAEKIAAIKAKFAARNK